MSFQEQIDLFEQQSSDLQSVIVQGQPLTELPTDLYIRPDALRIFLEAFSGPLDLLLYLIKKQDIDILDIPVTAITKQYMKYVDIMRQLDIDLASEYLVMAAILTEIKSRMLLPKPILLSGEEEEDPRVMLIEQLREYERFKQAAKSIDHLERVDRNVFLVSVNPPIDCELINLEPAVGVGDLSQAMSDVLLRLQLSRSYEIHFESFSVRERMSLILNKVKSNRFMAFSDLLVIQEGRAGLVVTLMAVLELLRQAVIDLIQKKPFSLISLQVVAHD